MRASVGHHTKRHAACLAIATMAAVAACGGDGDDASLEADPPSAVTSPPTETARTTETEPAPRTDAPHPTQPGGSGDADESLSCVVRLHGKGGAGWDTSVTDGVAEVAPTGNDEAWGGRQWLYFPDDRYDEARAIVVAAIDDAGCDAVVLNGFSNGASFVAALYCAGETFDGRLSGVVIDDPVPDTAVEGCSPAADVQAVLYWTTALADATGAGADCAAIDYTCAGGATLGIDAYAAELGLAVTRSPFVEHEWNWDAPEITAWLG